MWTIIVGLIAVIVCVGLNAFFVAAEFALVTVRHTWVEELVRSGNKTGPVVKASVDKLDDAIAATQLGITIASIALGWLGEPAVARLLEPVLSSILPVWHRAAAHTVATILSFAAITFLHVVLGELAPKAIALSSPEAVAMRVAAPLAAFRRAFHPVVWGMNAVGNAIVRRLGFAPASEHERSHSVGELKLLVAETHDAGDLDPTQAEVVDRALAMTEKRVGDVMLPMSQVQRVELEMSERELLERIYASQHTRLPVFSRKAQRWVGIANAKLILLQHLKHGRIDLGAAIYRPDTFHQAAPLPRALRTFKKRRQHMAFVAGDDGEKIGIVTLEDVLEELVGDIDDELDVEEAPRASGADAAAIVAPLVPRTSVGPAA